MVTPFKRVRPSHPPLLHMASDRLRQADTGERILINRGWVPEEAMAAEQRPRGQVAGEVHLEAVAVPRPDGKPNPFVPDNEPEAQRWFWADVPAMAAALRTQPVLIEAASSATPPGGFPKAGQSQVTVRNEHAQCVAPGRSPVPWPANPRCAPGTLPHGSHSRRSRWPCGSSASAAAGSGDLGGSAVGVAVRRVKAAK